ncbi:MAG: N-6 DNA methylase [Microcystis aeruginosa K13-05]|jgi:type I restriction-modification system DNA methylase subunit|uniref:Eco57I restriction-modification methylase domain-containing protein n=3 Tax=unclassified Microcystis TaxID=2643300 RepID=UPI0022CCBB90|nr:RNA-binding domain-containing protein [Microcystis sp. LE19-41.2A]MCZ8049798.1 putative DNA binding domain-containing protein [Microcystis sp. LE19-41.2A]NCR80269.1 N-6 DNA methylase [Microcystis aeruginosa K13-10]NCR84853.1 N-6 DNA methylase [Microcystis aeruginosa K13-05]
MSDIELRQSVYDLLSSLRGLDALKKLFWSELNYERENQTLSRRNWPDKAVEALAEDPILLASGGEDFQVIYARLNSKQLLLNLERLVVTQLLKNHPYTLFVFSDFHQERWHFINVKYDVKQEKRQVLRRITVGPGEQLRTATERLSLLDLDNISSESPLAIQERHDEAFDVEKVTKKFFEQYRSVFEKVEQLITKTLPNADQRRLFTQKLFNRLMFIVFIQKKGWLKFNEQTDYLETLWQDYQNDNSTSDKNFYHNRLTHLFFTGLNNPQQTDIISINNGGFLRQIIGTVPYLNGGLFEQDEDDRNPNIIVPDQAIDVILHKLFSNFNFTVTESTPLDVEVAVDPEMLGKVFEELVTGRHKSGSYYTPKPIVSFMCREALKGYLGGYEALVDEHNVEQINVPKARDLLQKLSEVKIVDPACGSGAYLLGMLHELHSLTRLLDTRAQPENARDDYHRKLNIIQNNLYGVDIDEFAVNIARLRLWLSLTVEFDGEHPEPLPNLDFKIESGDSLTAPNPENVGQYTLRGQIIRQYRDAKNSYLTMSEGVQKQILKQKINEFKAEIALITHGSNKVNGFDWAVEFAEVFSQKGFDIVLANPPYGATVGDRVRDLYFDRLTDGAQSKDTYGLFMARGLQLLRSGGQLCYIVSDTWRTIKTHKPLRKRFLESTTIAHFIDLPSWVFDATVNTCILTVAKNTASESHDLIAADLRSLQIGDWNKLTENLDAIAAHSVDLQTIDYARYTYPQSLIATYDNLSLFIGSPKLYQLLSNSNFSRLGTIADVKVGLQTSDNDYYLRKRRGARGSYEILDDSKLLTDADIAGLSDDEKLNGVALNKYNNRCFLPFDKGGESNTDEGWLPNYYVPTQYLIDWSRDAVHRLRTATIADVKRRKKEFNKIEPQEEQRIASRFQNSEYYFQEGITFSPTGIYSPTFRLGSGCIFGNKGSTIFVRGIESRVLLGFLTSIVSRYLLKSYVSHTVETGEEVLTRLRLPSLSPDLHDRIKTLVESIINQQKHNQSYPYHLHEQKEIDAIIYQLYELDYEDIREIELWYCRRYPKLAKAQGVLAEVKEKYERHIEHCSRVLTKPPTYWKSHPILSLIAQGEGSKLEFKETLRVDIKTNTKNKDVLLASLKNITAFLNTDGGTLLIGVSDNLEIKGLEPDYTVGKGKNKDGFENNLRQIMESKITPYPLHPNKVLVMVEFFTLPEGEICQVEVKPLDLSEIAYLEGKIFIRDGNRTKELKGDTLESWKQKRNPSLN